MNNFVTMNLMVILLKKLFIKKFKFLYLIYTYLIYIDNKNKNKKGYFLMIRQKRFEREKAEN